MKKILDEILFLKERILNWFFLERTNYLIQDITIAIVLINFAILYATADYTSDTDAPPNKWDKIWYVIEAAFYVFFALCGIVLNAKKTAIAGLYRKAWTIMASFFLIRTVWEISAVIQGVSVNEKIVMTVMFGITFLTIFIIVYLPQLVKLWQRLWHWAGK